MSKNNTSLEALREEINRIDDALQDLLMERAAIADNVRRSKHETPVWRPAREAQILRRLIMRHKGSFPRTTIIQIWREIVSAMVRLQGEFAVAIYNPKNNKVYQNLARDHFGCQAPLEIHSSARAALTAVQDGSATVCVLPIPEDSEDVPWWPILAGMTGGKAIVCARLPFGTAALTNGEQALCVAKTPAEESGKDNSLYVFQTSVDISRARLTDQITAAGLKPIKLIGGRIASSDVSSFLAEVDGYTDPTDPRVAHILDPVDGVADSARFLGAYATPFSTAELSNKAIR